MCSDWHWFCIGLSRDEDERTFRASTPLLLIGLVGNLRTAKNELGIAPGARLDAYLPDPSAATRGIIIEPIWRSSRRKTLRTIWCSCSSITPASRPSSRLAAISSSV